MRQYRWQILALVVAGSIFAIAVGFRMFRQPDTPVEPTATPTNSVTGEIATPATTQSEIATPAPAATLPNETAQVQAVTTTRSASNTFVEAVVGQVQRLNPLLAIGNRVEEDITSLIFEGLVKTNDFGEPSAALAKSWTVSGNGLEYVFELRDDVLWQDGIPFTADDVIFTMALLADETYPGPSQVSAFWETIEIEKLGDYLMRFQLTQPLASFADALSIGILPKHALDGIQASDLLNHPFNLSPIGTGPYQLASLRSADGEAIDAVDLVAAPNYASRSDAPAYDVTYLQFALFDTFDAAQTALANGQVDGLATQTMPQRLQLINLPGVEAYTAIAPEVGMLIFNWDEPDDRKFFSEQRVRWALQLGLDREPAINAQLSNQAIVANGPLVPTSWAYQQDLNWPGVDLQRAQDFIQNISLLRQTPAEDEAATDETDSEAPVEETAEDTSTESGVIYAFTIMVPQNDALIAIATDYAQRWQSLNLSISVEAVDDAVYQQRLLDGDFDADIVQYDLGSDPDEYAYWHIGQAPDGLNYGAVADDRISEILERARRNALGPNRLPLYHQFQSLFVERAIAIPLYYPLFTYAVRDNVDGVQMSFIGQPSDRFRTIADWRVN
ncbi:MAG: hypothetical protein CL607_14315 [Anaerolineaceae bacterium]|nr:hypothetical protein [Anaerolineaceae bacterium]